MRLLALVTDGFGGRGGIAQYNRDLLTALCADPAVSAVVGLPRAMPSEAEPLPPKLTWEPSGIGGKARYASTALRAALRKPRPALIFCGHLNLLPLAALLRLRLQVPLVLTIYGIEAWQPAYSLAWPYLASRLDGVIAISRLSRERFLRWAGLPTDRTFVLPNAVHAERYRPGPKDPALLWKYGLAGKTILMTVGRLDARERSKGVDEVLEALPALAVGLPDLAYMVVGDGTDRARLQAKARSLGVSDRVVFAGYVAEPEKPEYYRLADAYVMPCRGEGFGFVFLEAMATGLPVVASRADGSSEAVLGGELGLLVDPGSRDQLIEAVRQAVREPRGVVPAGLSLFSYSVFCERVSGILSAVLARHRAGRSTPK